MEKGFVAGRTHSCKSVTRGGIVRPFFLCSQEFMIASTPQAYAVVRVKGYW